MPWPPWWQTSTWNTLKTSCGHSQPTDTGTWLTYLVYSYMERKCKILSDTPKRDAGYAVAQLVEALRYKLEGRGFDSRWCHREFFIDVILPATLRPWG